MPVVFPTRQILAAMHAVKNSDINFSGAVFGWASDTEVRAEEERFWKLVLAECIILPTFLISGYLLYVPKTVRDAAPKATKEVLDAAHARAVKSTNTFDVADYQLLSPEVAQRDSARYARRINRFVKYHGEDYLVRVGLFTDPNKWYYIHTPSLYHYEPKMQKLVGKYENTIRQLEMNRRYQRQKH